MNHKEEPNLYRILSVFAVIVFTVVLTAVLCVRGHFYKDEWLCVVFLDIVFLSVYVFEMEYERRQGLLSSNQQTNFVRVSIVYSICALLTAVMAFLPEVFRPVMLTPVLLCGVSTPLLAVTAGLYFDLLLGLSAGADFYVFAGLCLLTLLGAVLGRALEKGKYRIWIAALFFMISILVPAVLYEFAFKQMGAAVYLGGAASGLLTAAAAVFIYPSLYRDSQEEVENRFYDIVSEDYSEVRALKDFSEKEYRHAVMVADVAYRCGKKMGFDEGLCLSGGFYYRLGFWVGEPYIDKGVERAAKLCFPQRLIELLTEYYGSQKLPSSPESALVHMVDVLVSKLEKGITENDKGAGDREFLVYQTLNELSQTGIYDHSGMSMNQFLKVREFLAKEEKLK